MAEVTLCFSANRPSSGMLISLFSSFHLLVSLRWLGIAAQVSFLTAAAAASAAVAVAEGKFADRESRKDQLLCPDRDLIRDCQSNLFTFFTRIKFANSPLSVIGVAL